ncbi:hypothetical protein MCUN1_001909 [Malassezia cuniculi]|uniref:Uncharacterized protein n=1 Tax=Malassezia cuniculi TaxID=948313 RepID=A0AAF0ER85_9BASI|nr:hypothetical protein MCUN1_001909 [Malassezia cuniculi]
MDVRMWPPDLVLQWLRQLGLSQYCSTFMENDINGEALVLLDEAALTELGISSVGHRMTLLTNIYELKQRFNVPMDQDDWMPQMYTPVEAARSTSPADLSTQLRHRDEHIKVLESYISRITGELQHMRDTLGRLAIPNVPPPPGTYGQQQGAGALINSGHPVEPMSFAPNGSRDLSSRGTQQQSYQPNLAARAQIPDAQGGQLQSQANQRAQIPPASTPTPGAAPGPSHGAAPAHVPHAPASSGSAMSSFSHLSPVHPTPIYGNSFNIPAGAPNPILDYLTPRASGSQDTKPIDEAVASLLHASGRSSVPVSNENVPVTIDEPCARVMALSLRKYGIAEDYSSFVLFVVFGDTERCLSYDERPLLLYRRLRESGQNPKFVLKYMFEVRSPIDMAQSKLQMRSAERRLQKHEALRARAVLVDMDNQSNDQRVFSVSHWLRQPSYSGYFGEELLRRAKVMGPGTQLPHSQGVTFAVAVYPYESDREDEYDVATGDTFVVLAKSKGWWTVRRDSVADGKGDIFMPVVRPLTDPSLAQATVPIAEIWTGWVPAGCLLELHRPLAEYLHGSGNMSPAAAIAFNTPAQGPLTPTARMRIELINAPVPLSGVASQGSNGTMLLDYNAPDGGIRVRKGDRVRVFKRYHSWSYCVADQTFLRGWVPSWYISRRSHASNPESQGSGMPGQQQPSTQGSMMSSYDPFAFKATGPSFADISYARGQVPPSTGLFVAFAYAHGDHGHTPLPPEAAKAPVDFWLGLHIALEALSWAVLFPLAMVLGLVRHRLHVPLSAAAVCISLGGYFFGSHHGGRQFNHTVHGTFSSLLFLILVVQAACGIYLKLHLKWAAERWLRPPVLMVHGILGRAFPVIGWTQMVFGIATLQSWCNGGHLGQCLAHYIMGSAFAAYSVILLIMLKVAVAWLSRTGRSQEFIDSWVILLWGIVNTFTEHQGGPWTHKDLQHTLMGVVWWAGGAAGIWLSRNGKRSVIPSFIILLTGWGMSGHMQALELSTKVHSLFGYTLMTAAVCRIVEVCFVLQDQPTGQGEPEPGSWFRIHAFQYLPPFLLVASGILFMSATDEEMRWAHSKGVDHVTWGLIDFSVAFVIFFWTNVLIDAYIYYGGRYGLSGAPSEEDGGQYIPVVHLNSPPTTPLHVISDDASRDAIPLGRYGQPAPVAETSHIYEQPQQQQQQQKQKQQQQQQQQYDQQQQLEPHVLFDEDDPFENSSTD